MEQKYIGQYTRREAEVIWADDVNENCAWVVQDGFCDREYCSFFGHCPYSIDLIVKTKTVHIPFEHHIDIKRLRKAAKYLDQSGFVPELPGIISIQWASYKHLAFRIKQVVDDLEPEQKARLNPFVLNIHSLIQVQKGSADQTFSKVPHSFISNELRNLTGNEAKVMLAILRYESINGDTTNFVGNEKIAELAGVSPTNVNKTIRSLKGKGYLWNEHGRGSHGQIKNNWYIYFSPQRSINQ